MRCFAPWEGILQLFPENFSGNPGLGTRIGHQDWAPPRKFLPQSKTSCVPSHRYLEELADGKQKMIMELQKEKDVVDGELITTTEELVKGREQHVQLEDIQEKLKQCVQIIEDEKVCD